jgi:hypothetical protein
MRFGARDSAGRSRHTAPALLKLAVAGVLVGLGLGGCDRISDLRGLSPEDARATAKEAYIAGYPLVTYYTAMYAQNIDTSAPTYKGPINTILSEAVLPTPGMAGANRPNGDVIVSTLQADLRSEPLILCFPDVPSERYFSMQVVDMNMYNVGSVDNRKSSGAAGCVMLMGPSFLGLVPTGVKQLLRSSTDFARVIYRTQVFGPADLDVAARMQSGFTLQPLSIFRPTSATPPPQPDIVWRKASAASFDSDFAQTLNFLMPMTTLADAEATERFARIGIGQARKKTFEELPAETRDAVLAGFADGKAAIAARAKTLEKRVNGWRVDSPTGDQSSFKGDHLLRAAAVSQTPFGPSAVDAMFLPVDTDSRGAPLDGAAKRYTITFPSGLQPPVNAFWSLSMYDGRTGGLVANSIERFRVDTLSAQRMVPGPDGSITIYLSPTSPGPGLEANWLPAPNGPFSLVLRMYMPKAKAPSILPAGSGSWSPPAVIAATAPAVAQTNAAAAAPQMTDAPQ